MTYEEKTIFISYRREDSAYAAGRLYDRLSPHFGADQIFMDIDTIDLGVDFVQQIETAVGACDVLLAVIGPRWLKSVDDEGRRRLDKPNDFVRLEVGAALERNIHVIPVLVDAATMPQLSELPDALWGLERKNGIEIGHSRFNTDVEKLIRGIEAIFESLLKEDKKFKPKPPFVEEITEGTSEKVREPIKPEKLAARDFKSEVNPDIPSLAIKPDKKLRQFVIYTMIGFAIGGLLSSIVVNSIEYGPDNGITPWVITGLISNTISPIFVGIALRNMDQRVDFNQIILVVAFGLMGGLLGNIITGTVILNSTDTRSTNWVLTIIGGMVTAILSGGMAGFGIGVALKQVVPNFQWTQVRKIAVAWIISHLLGGFLLGLIMTFVLQSISSSITPSSSNVLLINTMSGLIYSFFGGLIIGFIGGRTILAEVITQSLNQ